LIENNGVLRIIDANINRLKEGLRVCEEITRFVFDDNNLTASLKNARHQVDMFIDRAYPRKCLITCRNSRADTGRRLHTAAELKRNNIKDIWGANIQRVKESIRVLEEFTKLQNTVIAKGFKDMRYRIYDIEKQAEKRIKKLKGQ
jgi:thiamine-phosphate pyrophosphorylase